MSVWTKFVNWLKGTPSTPVNEPTTNVPDVASVSTPLVTASVVQQIYAAPIEATKVEEAESTQRAAGTKASVQPVKKEKKPRVPKVPKVPAEKKPRVLRKSKKTAETTKA